MSFLRFPLAVNTVSRIVRKEMSAQLANRCARRSFASAA
jgi:hypothetical protein